mmetsp:Transcript_35716/g.75236  ORF Transcript_35716/g.75236 Transcript_35716/m.75236 type:complete len:154 (-) Transcript_35716:27-488(-)
MVNITTHLLGGINVIYSRGNRFAGDATLHFLWVIPPRTIDAEGAIEPGIGLAAKSRPDAFANIVAAEWGNALAMAIGGRPQTIFAALGGTDAGVLLLPLALGSCHRHYGRDEENEEGDVWKEDAVSEGKDCHDSAGETIYTCITLQHSSLALD